MPPSVVLVHTLRSSSTMWRHQRETLARHGITTIAPDLPGHGTRMDERFTLEEALATIDRAVTDAPAPVVLVGCSLGGYLSVHYAGLEHRDIIGLVAASCGTQPLSWLLDSYRLAAGAIHALPDKGAALNHAAVKAFVRDPQLAEDVEAGGVALEVMDDVLRELDGLDMRGSLRRIEQPVWLVNGQWDHFRLQERSFLKATRRGRLVRVKRAGHLVNVSRPEEFDRILLDAIAVFDR